MIEKNCSFCGNTIRTYPSVDRKYCDSECFSKDQKNGSHKKCLECGEKFYSPKSRSDQKYCSRECYIFENNPNTEHKVSISCDYCDSVIERIPSRVRRTEKDFCNYECKRNWFSENNTGEDHWSHISGTTDDMGARWETRRVECIERYDGYCQLCLEQKENLHVHHVIPRRLFDDRQVQNEEWNLIPLCESCHQPVESMTRKFLDKLDIGEFRSDVASRCAQQLKQMLAQRRRESI